MEISNWLSLAGLVVSVVLTVTPWLFAMHARLAVIANQIQQLCETVEKLAEAHDRRLAMCIDHQSRLETHDVRLSNLENQIETITA